MYRLTKNKKTNLVGVYNKDVKVTEHVFENVILNRSNTFHLAIKNGKYAMLDSNFRYLTPYCFDYWYYPIHEKLLFKDFVFLKKDDYIYVLNKEGKLLATHKYETDKLLSISNRSYIYNRITYQLRKIVPKPNMLGSLPKNDHLIKKDEVVVKKVDIIDNKLDINLLSIVDKILY